MDPIKELVSLKAASETFAGKRGNAVTLLSAYVESHVGLIMTLTENVIALRSEQSALESLEFQRNHNSQQPFGLGEEIQRQSKVVESNENKLKIPLESALNLTLAVLRKVHFFQGPHQIVESVIERIPESISLVPVFDRLNVIGPGSLIKFQQDNVVGTRIAILPEALLSIENRSYELCLGAFMACVEAKRSLGESVATNDVRQGVRTILDLAIGANQHIDFIGQGELEHIENGDIIDF